MLGAASLIQVAGALIHAAAFPTAAQRLDTTELSPAMISASKALWLADSTNLLVLGAIFAFLALRPRLASGSLLMLLGLAPLASAALLYWFMGAFFAGHLMLLTAALVLLAGWLKGSASPVSC